MPERAELLEALRHTDPDVRRRAARALDHLPLDDQTVEGLRSAATEPRVQAALRAALNDAAFKIRWKVACVILPFEEREAMRASR